VNIVDYEGEDKVEIETEPEKSNFAKGYEESAICVVQWLLCSQKVPYTTQQHQIFYSICSVKNKEYNLIIDNENCENIILVH